MNKQMKRVGWTAGRIFATNLVPLGWAMGRTKSEAIAAYERACGEGTYARFRSNFSMKIIPVYVLVSDLKKEN